jgi:hypothetical protein
MLGHTQSRRHPPRRLKLKPMPLPIVDRQSENLETLIPRNCERSCRIETTRK